MRRDTTQIESVQILRAVAAMAVLIYHTHYVIGIVLGVESYPALAFGAAGVDLFFVISGFVMVYVSEPLFGKPGATLKFWTRRVIRIVPLYWTMTTLLLIYLTARYGGVDYVGKPGRASSHHICSCRIQKRAIPHLSTRSAGLSILRCSFTWWSDWLRVCHVAHV